MFACTISGIAIARLAAVRTSGQQDCKRHVRLKRSMLACREKLGGGAGQTLMCCLQPRRHEHHTFPRARHERSNEDFSNYPLVPQNPLERQQRGYTMSYNGNFRYLSSDLGMSLPRTGPKTMSASSENCFRYRAKKHQGCLNLIDHLAVARKLP